MLSEVPKAVDVDISFTQLPVYNRNDPSTSNVVNGCVVPIPTLPVASTTTR
jgi:hypothetical protein